MIMRTFFVAAALALAACSPPPATTAAPAGKPNDAAAVQPSAPQPAENSGKPDAAGTAQANLITPQFLVGRWGDNGDCTKDVVLNADGSFHSYTGGDGHWQINGDSIVMSGPDGTTALQMQLIDQNHLMLRNPDGSVGTSQRC